MRLFAAVPVPRHVREHLELPLTNLRLGAGAGLRWVPAEYLHVTVAFYGTVPDGAAPDVEAALAEVVGTAPPMDLLLRGAGSFSGRTLWVGVAGDVQALTRLMADAAAGPYAQERDDPRRPEPQRAHVTVARASRRSRGTDLGPLARALAVYEGPSWRADAVGLYSSHLGEGPGGGPRYELLAHLPLVAT